MDTKFSKDALFAGMTSNAFKLGTVLSLGWFWQRTGGCHNVYRGQDGVMDYKNIQAVMDLNDTEITIEGQALPPETIWHYIRRQTSGCGQESEDSDACIVRIDENGDMIPAVPNVPENITAVPVAGGKIKLRWLYSAADEEIAPTGFKVYVAAADAEFDFDNPDATVSYSGQSSHSWESAALTDGQRYKLVVRSYATAGGETQNTEPVSAVADATGPDAIENLIAGYEEID